MNILEIARYYYNLGWSIVPCPLHQKYPLLAWKHYQAERATEQNIYHWFCRPSNLALVTGALSGIIVLDIDGPEGMASIEGKEIPPTPCVRTGRGGLHYYYRHPGFETGNWAGKLPGVDFRGDGGLVILPPSVHPNGKLYEWLISPSDAPLASAPAWFLELIKRAEYPNVAPAERHISIGDGSPYGQGALRRAIQDILRAAPHARNNTLNQAAFAIGHLVAGGELSRTTAEEELIDAGIRVGQDPAEAEKTVKSGLDSGEKEPRCAPSGSLWKPHVEKNYLTVPQATALKRRHVITGSLCYVRSNDL